MPRPRTAFDQPQATLLPDLEPRQYANVDNMLEYVTPALHKHLPVVVPSVLFSIMKDILKIAPDEAVTMYLVQEEDLYVYGIAWAGETGADYADLWLYTGASLPTMFRF